MRYTIIIVKASNTSAAYAPDLPRCMANGYTRGEAIRKMREAIEFHIESLRDYGEPVPEPSTTAAVLEFGTAAGI